METITELEYMAARHWRGTEEQRLGGRLRRAADGFTGRANSALPLGDPGMPLGDALGTVIRWHRARALPPMIAVPLPLEGDSPRHQLDNHLSERSWLTRPGHCFVMVADLATVPPAGDLPADLRLPLLPSLSLPRRPVTPALGDTPRAGVLRP